MDSDTLKFLANFLAKKAAAWAAGSLVTIGALQPNQETQFITMGSGIIVGLLAFIWSWWNDRGKSAVLAELAKAHGVVSQSASTAKASKAIVAAVNDNKIVPVGSGAVKIAAMLLFGFLFVLQGVPANAAAAANPLAGISAAVDNFVAQLQAKQAQDIQNVISALQEADADAGQVIVPATATSPAVVKDPLSHACYPAQVQYLQSLPTAQPIKSQPPYNLIVMFQYKRDFVNMLLSGQLIPAYLKLGCSALIGNEAAIFAATAGLVGIAPAAIAPISAFAGSFGAAAVAFPVLAIPK
jgi:hypothetical protein